MIILVLLGLGEGLWEFEAIFDTAFVIYMKFLWHFKTKIIKGTFLVGVWRGVDMVVTTWRTCRTPFISEKGMGLRMNENENE